MSISNDADRQALAGHVAGAKEKKEASPYSIILTEEQYQKMRMDDFRAGTHHGIFLGMGIAALVGFAIVNLIHLASLFPLLWGE